MRVKIRICGVQAIDEVGQLSAQTVMRNGSAQIFGQRPELKQAVGLLLSWKMGSSALGGKWSSAPSKRKTCKRSRLPLPSLPAPMTPERVGLSLSRTLVPGFSSVISISTINQEKRFDFQRTDRWLEICLLPYGTPLGKVPSGQ